MLWSSPGPCARVSAFEFGRVKVGAGIRPSQKADRSNLPWPTDLGSSRCPQRPRVQLLPQPVRPKWIWPAVNILRQAPVLIPLTCKAISARHPAWHCPPSLDARVPQDARSSVGNDSRSLRTPSIANRHVARATVSTESDCEYDSILHFYTHDSSFSTHS